MDSRPARVQLRLFARLRELAGRAEIEREIHGSSVTVGELWRDLQREYPRLSEFRGTIAFAVDQVYVDSDFVVPDNAEVAFFPPVSGG